MADTFYVFCHYFEYIQNVRKYPRLPFYCQLIREIVFSYLGILDFTSNFRGQHCFISWKNKISVADKNFKNKTLDKQESNKLY